MKLRAAAQIELRADVLAMGVDRVHADIQLPSDVAGAFAPPDQLEYLQRTGFDCELGVDRKLLVESVWACAPWTAKVREGEKMHRNTSAGPCAMR